MLPSTESYDFEMLRSELSWIVGDDNCRTDASEILAHSIDYYWVPECWHDRGQKLPGPDFVVSPANAQEVSKVLQFANTYHLPVTPGAAAAARSAAPSPSTAASRLTPSG